MRQMMLWIGTACSLACGAAACEWLFRQSSGPQVGSAQATLPTSPVGDSSTALYAVSSSSPKHTSTASEASAASIEPMIIGDCRLTAFEKQDVPSERDGIIRVFGRECQPGEVVPADRLELVTVQDTVYRYYRWKEGDVVGAGYLLAVLDDRLAREELVSKRARVASGQADLEAARKTRDEAKNRYDTQVKLQNAGRGVVSDEEVRGALLQYQRYCCEVISKEESLRLAQSELRQAEILLSMYQIRSAIPGVIKSIFKRRGEAVRTLEPICQLQSLRRLRVEGLAEEQFLPRLRSGASACVEPVASYSPARAFAGHLAPITALACGTRNGHGVVASVSEDGTCRVWSLASGEEELILSHRNPVLSVACATSGKLATGTTEGTIRLWDLQGGGHEPTITISVPQRAAVSCLACSPDGAWLASGGEDRAIRLWRMDTGELQYTLSASHAAGITALQFAPDARLVSASRDGSLKVWLLGSENATLVTTLEHRSNDLVFPGINQPGTQTLLEQDQQLRLMSLTDGRSLGALRHANKADSFSTFALFSPDGQLVASAGGAEVHARIWRTPTATSRGYELRRLIAPQQDGATCAVFSPDGKSLITGGRRQMVMVWDLPRRAEIERRHMATVTLVERALEASNRQIRVWAELDNVGDELIPGSAVTLTIPPPAPDGQ